MWIVGIDEAGYGPNLGPFVMSAVACRVPDGQAECDLWQVLAEVVRRHGGKGKDPRVVVDDSKAVYTSRGLAGLERGVLGVFGQEMGASLAELLSRLCPDTHDRDQVAAEAWYTGASPLPGGVEAGKLAEDRARLSAACTGAGLGWLASSVVVCPRRFNALLDRHQSKGVILADAFQRLLLRLGDVVDGEGVRLWVDKQGGRNSYAAQVQHGLRGGAVVVEEERMERSCYRVLGLGQEWRVTFQPRADGEQFCVALASMVSKYVRELLMAEFNAFWQKHVRGLKATAGYPADAGRFFEAIRPAALALGIAEEALWRRK
jgi:hypothetical protein